MSQESHIREALSSVEARIATAAAKSGRDPDDVRLLLATKTVDAQRVIAALRAGRRLLGENKVLEGETKADEIRETAPDLKPCWHVIGHLQTNKIKNALRYATCIQSVDRVRLIEKLDQRLQFEGRAIDIMLQVNTSREDSKFGIPPEKAIELARTAAQYDTLRITGLMTIGLLGATPEDARQSYTDLRHIQKQILEAGIDNCSPHELSMGMSGDMEVAIEEGATMVRVGTAIFGKRAYPDSYYWPK